MASTIHAALPPYPAPSFSRSTTASSMSGIHFSQPSLNPFDTQQSVASTPTATPPPTRGHQPHMSFNMGSYGPPNGVHMQHGGSRAYGELNGTMLQQQYPPGQKPQIYTASNPQALQSARRACPRRMYFVRTLALILSLSFRRSILVCQCTKWR